MIILNLQCQYEIPICFVVKKALKAWNKEKFLNPCLQVNDLLADIEKLYQSNLPDALQQINCLTSQITKLWTQDEMYWHQRSRINWLKLGDQNSNFFHHTTLQRRQFNKILRVQMAMVFGWSLKKIFSITSRIISRSCTLQMVLNNGR